ncbi:MAG TPA: DNA replication/repair protein RecF [Bdellovibrionota bacterium]|nr:DNA replication/repair protein RecF [Bdellovibrionota bacterium]
MKVERLTLRNFRNVIESSFSPDEHLNFLIGANGQGKTSFLEALGYLAMLRSFRGAKAADVLRWGAVTGDVACLLSSQDDTGQKWKTELQIRFERTRFALTKEPEKQKVGKTAFINGKAYRSSTQYLSQRFGSYELGFHTVVFNPADHDLVRGDPAVRRAYLDRVISAFDVDYLNTLQKYHHVIEQRNALLKAAAKPAPEHLHGFTEQLAKHAAVLTRKRLECVQRLAEKADYTARQITVQRAPLRLYYSSTWVPEIDGISITNSDIQPVYFTGQGALPSLELLERAFWKRQSKLEAAEWKAGHSLVGPHRDDWAFFLGDHGQTLKSHGSQGEVRSTLLSLKLSEIELFRTKTGHRPLFLLDDFSSELDQERRLFLLRFLSETDLQVFVTTTEEVAFDGKRFSVANGSISS